MLQVLCVCAWVCEWVWPEVGRVGQGSGLLSFLDALDAIVATES